MTGVSDPTQGDDRSGHIGYTFSFFWEEVRDAGKEYWVLDEKE